MNNPQQLIDEIGSILDAVKASLPEENVTDACELLEHDEWGEALSLICTQLYEYDVPISSEIYDRIESAGLQMQMPPKEWEILRELI